MRCGPAEVPVLPGPPCHRLSCTSTEVPIKRLVQPTYPSALDRIVPVSGFDASEFYNYDHFL